MTLVSVGERALRRIGQDPEARRFTGHSVVATIIFFVLMLMR
jgi:hypothetical protein